MTRLEAAMANVDAYNAAGARDPAREAELVAAVNDAICDALTEAVQNPTPIPINAEGQRMVLEAMGLDPDAPRLPEGKVVPCPVTEEDVALRRMRFEVWKEPREFKITFDLRRDS